MKKSISRLSRLRYFYYEQKNYFIKYRPVLRNNLEFKDSYPGKRCFIIGNGQSIKEQDLILLKDEFTFVVNSFYRHTDYEIIHPSFYCMIDELHFNDSEISRKILFELGQKLHKDTVLFFPADAGPYIEKNQLYQDNKKYYLYMSGEFGENFNIEIEKKIPDLVNVILSCLITARYMGFSEIYLLGCDHDWLKNRNMKKHDRFYSQDYLQGYLENVTYEECMAGVHELFRSYRILKNKLNNIKIYNCSPGSYLDVFEFADYHEVIERDNGR